MTEAISTLPGTGVPCTPDVLARVEAIAVPFVRRVTAVKVAEAARAQGVALVDAAFFARAASY
ncbi:MAG: hypothetical protein HYV93_23940 [Candidatus Rokubacteria bacterium]|nr:hypothetical protein [Candidatus Rokubacteria bacterium]